MVQTDLKGALRTYFGFDSFKGRQEDIINNVLNGSYNMKSEVWNTVSNDAKDLISKLLQRSADVRLTT